jgi:CHAT domain-containing protein
VSGVFHLATHAFANDAAPLRSALVFSPDKGEGFGLLYANDIYDLPLRADLAVLSACATARGQATGEGLMGLAWAFLVAGCPSTIGTRWDADDAASEAWVTAFYTHYTTAKATKAQSVRAACLHLLTTRKYAAPHNWANWTLIGSDR